MKCCRSWRVLSVSATMRDRRAGLDRAGERLCSHVEGGRRRLHGEVGADAVFSTSLAEETSPQPLPLSTQYDMTDLWPQDSPAPWRAALERYPEVIALQGVSRL